MICPAAFSLLSLVFAWVLGFVSWALVRAAADVIETFRSRP